MSTDNVGDLDYIILTMMTIVGLTLFLLRASFGAVLLWLLPLVYSSVIVFGILLLLGTMTLPCAGPIIVSAFVLGTGSINSLADGLLYALAFGLGFDWPLIALPLLASRVQRLFTSCVVGRYALLTLAAGVLLVGIGMFGIRAEILPTL